MSYQATTPVSNQVGILHLGNIALPTLQYGFSQTTVAGSVIIPAAPTGFAIAVTQIVVNASAAVTVFTLFTSSGVTKVFTGGVSIGAAAFFVLPHSPCPWITCLPGDGLEASWTGAATISGSVNYVLLPVPPPFP